ncbi:MAG: hypothetical protein AAF487_11720 [Bacteroidota bacterium]
MKDREKNKKRNFIKFAPVLWCIAILVSWILHLIVLEYGDYYNEKLPIGFLTGLKRVFIAYLIVPIPLLFIALFAFQYLESKFNQK